MRPTYTIVDLFETPARARVLRAVAKSPRPLSIRGVSRAAGVSHTAASTVLKELHAMGLVTMVRVGRATAVELERASIYVQRMLLPTIEAEDSIVVALRADLTSTFSHDALSLVLFGSYAFGEQREGSDIDLLAIVADERARQQMDELARQHHQRFWRTYGSALALLTYTTAEVDERIGGPSSAFRVELDSTGIILHGLGPREWRFDASARSDKVGPPE